MIKFQDKIPPAGLYWFFPPSKHCHPKVGQAPYAKLVRVNRDAARRPVIYHLDDAARVNNVLAEFTEDAYFLGPVLAPEPVYYLAHTSGVDLTVEGPFSEEDRERFERRSQDVRDQQDTESDLIYSLTLTQEGKIEVATAPGEDAKE